MRVLISVTDKTGVADFARGLAALGAELIPPAARPACSAMPASRFATSPR